MKPERPIDRPLTTCKTYPLLVRPMLTKVRTISLLASLFVLLVGNAQGQTMRVIGFVCDEGQTAIENVHIVDEKGERHAVSNINGIFQMEIPDTPVKLKVSHVSFETKEVAITKKMLNAAKESGILTLELSLNSNLRTLQEVVIDDSRIQMAYPNKKAWILDYEMMGEYFIFLLLEDNKKIVRMISIDNDDEYVEAETPRWCNNLYKDCFGFFHLLAKDSAYQMLLHEGALIIPYSAPIESFNNLIKPCHVSAGDKIVLQRYSYYNQFVSYIMLDKNTKEEKVFVSVLNKEQGDFNASYMEDIIGMRIHYDYNEEAGVYKVENQEEIDALAAHEAARVGERRKTVEEDHFFTVILCKPTYQPIKYINGNIYLFNHYDGKIVRYDREGNQLSEVEINYHKEKLWANEILVNEEQTRCFAKFCQNGAITLHEIDLTTGKLSNVSPLLQHSYPEKIKIKGNTVYYMHREKRVSDDHKRYLWQQPLEESQ